MHVSTGLGWKCSHAKSDGHRVEPGAFVGMRQTPVVSRSMASSPLAEATPHRMLSAAEVGGPLTGCSGPPGFVSCLAVMRERGVTRRARRSQRMQQRIVFRLCVATQCSTDMFLCWGLSGSHLWQDLQPSRLTLLRGPVPTGRYMCACGHHRHFLLFQYSNQSKGPTQTRRGCCHGHPATADPPHPPRTPAPA